MSGGKNIRDNSPLDPQQYFTAFFVDVQLTLRAAYPPQSILRNARKSLTTGARFCWSIASKLGREVPGTAREVRGACGREIAALLAMLGIDVVCVGF